MIDFTKVLKFLFVNAVGFFLTPLILTVAVKFGFFPKLSGGGNANHFEFILAGGMWFWIAGGLASVGCFFVEGKKMGRWLIFAPLYLPFIYDIAALIYTNITASAG